MFVTIVSFRIGIIVSRVHYIMGGDPALQLVIDNLHIGYFSAIATVESVGAAFLLYTFGKARRTRGRLAIKDSLFTYLSRSTEVRIALLALIGITRAIIRKFQFTAQSATNLPNQLDRFIYLLQCMFPIML